MGSGNGGAERGAVTSRPSANPQRCQPTSRVRTKLTFSEVLSRIVSDSELYDDDHETIMDLECLCEQFYRILILSFHPTYFDDL